MAALTAAGAPARAAPPDDVPAPAFALTPADIGPFDPLGNMASLAWDDGDFPALRTTLLMPADDSRLHGLRFGFRGQGGGLGYRFRDGVSALSLVVAPRQLLPAPVPRPGSRRARLLLPVWVQMAFGSWSVLGGGGYVISPGAGNRDSWRSGLAVTRALSPRLSLGAEFSHESADIIDGHANTGLGVGASYRLTGPFSLMVSGGPYVEHHGGTGMKAYAGLNIAF